MIAAGGDAVMTAEGGDVCGGGFETGVIERYGVKVDPFVDAEGGSDGRG